MKARFQKGALEGSRRKLTALQKGIDVKFSIDDLMSKTEPEGWDGVRNAVARNNMRAMREVGKYIPEIILDLVPGVISTPAYNPVDIQLTQS